MRALRWVFTIAALLATALLLAVTLTVPAIVATAPAVLTLGFGLVAFVLWPKRHKTVDK